MTNETYKEVIRGINETAMNIVLTDNVRTTEMLDSMLETVRYISKESESLSPQEMSAVRDYYSLVESAYAKKSEQYLYNKYADRRDRRK